MTDKKRFGFASICAKDFPEDNHSDFSHTLPIYASSTFIYPNAEQAMSVFRGEADAYIYSRWGNPTVDAVEKKIAALEGFNTDMELSAKMFSSGMAAISSLFMATLKPGDTIITHRNIYGTTTELMNVLLKDLNIKTVFADLKNMNQLEEQLKNDPSIKMAYVETPANPTIECFDLKAISKKVREYDVLLAVDNTFATPYLQQPFKFGADFVVHSTTKFLNGHGTALGGVIVGKDKEFMKVNGWRIRKLLGGNSNPFEAWLLNNGLKTLPLRMDKHTANAKSIAEFLKNHPAVSKVNYSGLPDHPDHKLAKKQMYDFGGMLSFELKGGLNAGIALMNNIKFCTLTASLGTPDTLIQHPASMTHVQVPKEQREAGGITDGLIRLSIGIEDAKDVMEDLDAAMKHS